MLARAGGPRQARRACVGRQPARVSFPPPGDGICDKNRTSRGPGRGARGQAGPGRPLVPQPGNAPCRLLTARLGHSWWAPPAAAARPPPARPILHMAGMEQPGLGVQARPQTRGPLHEAPAGPKTTDRRLRRRGLAVSSAGLRSGAARGSALHTETSQRPRKCCSRGGMRTMVAENLVAPHGGRPSPSKRLGRRDGRRRAPARVGELLGRRGPAPRRRSTNPAGPGPTRRGLAKKLAAFAAPPGQTPLFRRCKRTAGLCARGRGVSSARSWQAVVQRSLRDRLIADGKPGGRGYRPWAEAPRKRATRAVQEVSGRVRVGGRGRPSGQAAVGGPAGLGAAPGRLVLDFPPGPPCEGRGDAQGRVRSRVAAPGFPTPPAWPSAHGPGGGTTGTGTEGRGPCTAKFDLILGPEGGPGRGPGPWGTSRTSLGLSPLGGYLLAGVSLDSGPEHTARSRNRQTCGGAGQAGVIPA